MSNGVNRYTIITNYGLIDLMVGLSEEEQDYAWPRVGMSLAICYAALE